MIESGGTQAGDVEQVQPLNNVLTRYRRIMVHADGGQQAHDLVEIRSELQNRYWCFVGYGTLCTTADNPHNATGSSLAN